MYIFVEGLFRDIPTNFYLSPLIFDRPRAKGKLAPFSETRVHVVKSQSTMKYIVRFVEASGRRLHACLPVHNLTWLLFVALLLKTCHVTSNRSSLRNMFAYLFYRVAQKSKPLSGIIIKSHPSLRLNFSINFDYKMKKRM